jgi:hypothetical protein
VLEPPLEPPTGTPAGAECRHHHRDTVVKALTNLAGYFGQIGIVLIRPNDVEADILSAIDQLADNAEDIATRHLRFVEDIQTGDEVVYSADSLIDWWRDGWLTSKEQSRNEPNLCTDGVEARGELPNQAGTQQRLTSSQYHQLWAVSRSERRHKA